MSDGPTFDDEYEEAEQQLRAALLSETKVTMEEALATALDAVMKMNGEPSRKDSPGYFSDPGLFRKDLRTWQSAKKILEVYSETKIGVTR